MVATVKRRNRTMKGQIARLRNRALDIAYFPGCEWFTLPRRRGRVACLVYHRVVTPSNDTYSFMTRGGVPAIDPDELASDLAYLKSNGALFLTFDDLRAGHFPSDREWGVIASFDDCLYDNYTQGLDVLSTFGIKAVFFQTSGLVDRQELIWEHRLYWYSRNEELGGRLLKHANEVLTEKGLPLIAHQNDVVHTMRDQIAFAVTADILERASADAALNDPTPQLPGRLYPTSDQVRGARRAGHEIGCHGHLHLKRANIPVALFRSDLERSKAALADILGEVPASYSFPFSSFSPSDTEIARTLFDVVATVERTRVMERPDDRVLAPRFTWPGPAKNGFRKRRWLLAGTI
jgi:peptidoglycan/xylan/chitin deacetylase (PgdA/CDA1 family)